MTYSNEDTVLESYLNEVNKVQLLTREEEDTIARAAINGDKEARQKLIKAHLRFVVKIAKKYQNQWIPLIDLINEGNIGLMQAIDKFDPDKGFHFISYAVWWIRQSILKAISENSRMIRLPLNRANELVQIEKGKKRLLENSIDTPGIKEIAVETNLSEKVVKELTLVSQDLLSLEAPTGDDGDESSKVHDFLVDETSPSPEEFALSSSLVDDINRVLGSLTQKEANILEYRFGLNGKRSLSLKDLGERYEVSKERVRQIEKRALGKLKQPPKKELLAAYVA